MQKNCLECGINFEITKEDLDFYKKVSPRIAGEIFQIPPPRLCPDCRQERRLTFRNERKLYLRKCDLCSKEIVSIYDNNTVFPVFCASCWWSDKWDSTKFGQDFDFNKTFFEQFGELKNKVPTAALLNKNSENSEYTHLETDSKNCYMNFGGHYNEECHYNLHAISCTNCLDSYFIENCELCYECYKCHNCHNTIYSYWCFNCHDCQFCADLKGCSDCFGCIGLRHKQYYFFNQKLTKEEYEQKISQFVLNYQNIKWALSEFHKLWLKSPHIALRIENSENSLGDFIKNCKNCSEVYEVEDAEDAKFCDVCLKLKDCYDGTRIGYDTELCYENMAGTFLVNTLFSNFSFDHLNNCIYIDNCFSSDDLFGCTNMHHKKYCILNKQYTKEVYEKLVPKIIEHMVKFDEWGEFFPVSLSPFSYNETVAEEYFLLTKEEVLKKGWQWKEEVEPILDVKKIIQSSKLPDNIADIPDDILNWAIKCEKTGKPFKIQKSELDFYRKMNLPVPRLHPDVRHSERIKRRKQKQLWDRNCEKCGIKIKTTFTPQMPERVFCEKCYLEEIN